jgi:RimJ/RimL family protein N-acetyltransferase
MVTKETTRLLLRPPAVTDLDPFVEIHEHPDVVRFLSGIGPATGRVAAWRLLALLIGHWHLRGYGQWTVVEKATGELIGRVGLWHPEGWPGLELGWVIRRSRWENGFATEAARAAVDFAFNEVGADRIISMIQPDNPRSIRVALKIGETFAETQTFNGQTLDVYAMTNPRRRTT